MSFSINNVDEVFEPTKETVKVDFESESDNESSTSTVVSDDELIAAAQEALGDEMKVEEPVITEYDDLDVDEVESLMETLKVELGTVKTNMTTKNRDLKKKAGELKKAKEALRTLLNKVTSITQEHTELKEESETLMTEKKELDLKMSTLKAKKAGFAKAERQATPDAKYAKSKTAIKNAEKKLESLENRLKVQTELLEKWENEDLAGKSDNVKTKQVEKIEKKKETLEQIQEDIDNQVVLITGLNETHDELLQEVKVVIKGHKASLKKAKKGTKDHNNLTKKIEKLEKLIEE